MTDYGTDLATHYTDPPDLSWRVITGARALAESIVRRWLTPRGTLPTNADCGVDLRAALNGAITQTALYRIAEALQAEAEADDRVSTCAVTLSFDSTTSTLTVSAAVDPATPDSGEFEMVFSISPTTISRLVVR